MRIFLALYSLFSRFVCRIKGGLYKSGILKARKASLPVVSVGNIALGGTEKTPLAMELISFFQNLGLRPALVSRGYKGKWEREGDVLSDGQTITGSWEDSGDEPYMVARAFPKAGVFIGKDRFASCQKAGSLGFGIAVLDDGFQHVRLHRDLDIVLHSLRESPALREGLSSFRRAHLLLLKTGGPQTTRQRIRALNPEIGVFDYSVSVKGFSLLGKDEVLSAADWRGKKVLAFCGIARPERFFSLLEACGLVIAARLSFPDHHAYPPRSVDKIIRTAEKLRPEAVVTTEKDAVKIVAHREKLGPAPAVVLKIGLELPEAFFERIRDALAKVPQVQT
jgi:tetraacyldisaccharide 4'-kinase